MKIMTKQIQKTIGATRQKAVLAIFILFISISSNAQDHDWMPTEQKEINLTEKFKQIEVKGNITVVLTNETVTRLTLQGNARDLSKVNASVKDEKLVIDAEKKRGYSKLIVYVPASNASSLVINGDTNVYSSGAIKIDDLAITLNGVSSVSLRYQGKVKVTPGVEYYLTAE
jgi:Putative auto-transporter adhesin, head GIN domain